LRIECSLFKDDAIPLYISNSRIKRSYVTIFDID